MVQTRYADQEIYIIPWIIRQSTNVFVKPFHVTIFNTCYSITLYKSLLLTHRVHIVFIYRYFTLAISEPNTACRSNFLRLFTVYTNTGSNILISFITLCRFTTKWSSLCETLIITRCISLSDCRPVCFVILLWTVWSRSLSRTSHLVLWSDVLVGSTFSSGDLVCW